MILHQAQKLCRLCAHMEIVTWYEGDAEPMPECPRHDEPMVKGRCIDSGIFSRELMHRPRGVLVRTQ